MGRKAKRQQPSGKKGKKGPGRAGGGPSKAGAKALPTAGPPQLPPGTGVPRLPTGVPQALPPPGGAGPGGAGPGAQPPDPFGLRRPR